MIGPVSAEQVERAHRLIAVPFTPDSRWEAEAREALTELVAALQQRNEQIAQLIESNESLKQHRATIQGVVRRAEEAEAALTESREREKRLREGITWLRQSIVDETDGTIEHMGDVASYCRELLDRLSPAQPETGDDE
jgi:chromosome segregation ATPase